MPIDRLGNAPAPALGDLEADAPTSVEDAAEVLAAQSRGQPSLPAEALKDEFGLRPDSYSELRPVVASAQHVAGRAETANLWGGAGPAGADLPRYTGPRDVGPEDLGPPAPPRAAAPVSSTEPPTSGATTIDVNAAVRRLRLNAHGTSLHRCAEFVRKALEAGGFDSTGRPGNAREYGPYLEARGFEKQDPAVAGNPQAGDIIVLQPTPDSHPAGHIAMYDGRQWISDFRQLDYWGGPAYRNQASYEIWRP